MNCPKAVALISSETQRKKNQVRCLYSAWSEWTPCSKTCGNSAVQIRTRQVLLKNEDINECNERLEKQNCEIMPCLIENEHAINNNYR